MKIYQSNNLGKLTLKNRVIMPPMCTYSSHNQDGMPNSFHYTHYVSRAIGQVGLIIVEATGVVPEGRITDHCLGIWNDQQMHALEEIVKGVHRQGSKIALQLNHAGRKCTANVDTIYAPSAIAYDDQSRKPKALTHNDIQDVIHAFVQAAKRANQAGFDAIEIHMAHGYLLSEFMSPITNKRDDKYKDASVLFVELLAEIKKVWPKQKPIIIRVSATDYEENGYDVYDTISMIEPILNDVDLIHVSSGGITPKAPRAYPGYQVDFATIIKEKTNKPVVAVGLITSIEQAIDIVENERADYVAIGRALLRNPHWLLEGFVQSNRKDLIPKPYLRGYR